MYLILTNPTIVNYTKLLDNLEAVSSKVVTGSYINGSSVSEALIIDFKDATEYLYSIAFRLANDFDLNGVFTVSHKGYIVKYCKDISDLREYKIQKYGITDVDYKDAEEYFTFKAMKLPIVWDEQPKIKDIFK